MKKLLYVNLTLSILSTFFILQIEFLIIPLIPCNLSIVTCDRINTLIANFSEGCLLSIFFWLLLVYFPDRYKYIKTRKITVYQIRNILFRMYNQIGIILQTNSIQKKLAKIQEDDLKQIKIIDAEEIVYEYKVLSNKKYWLPITIKNKNLISYLYDENKEIISIIDKLFTLPIISNEKIEIVEILTKLRHCYFFEKLEKEHNNLSICDGLLYKSFYEYIQWIILLDKEVGLEILNKEKFV